MNPDLEVLLKAWDAFESANVSGPEVDRLYANYMTRLEDICSRLGASSDLIHRLVKHAYPRWKRANTTGFPTIPPNA